MKMYRPHRLCPRNSKPKEPSLYRSLCVSILCMFLSTVMLVGTTMAWFSDSLQTGVYTISSANFTVTTFFCPDLAGGSGANNWQRLNPGNATMFGGGTLSGSSSYQTAYLKIVNDSNIDLKYTLTITNTNGDTAGGTGSTLPLSLAYKLVDNETGLNAALTSSDEGSNSENTGTGTTISFTVPKATTVDGAANPTIKFVALKLSLTNEPPASTDSEQPATQYKFGLRLEIMQDQEGAGVTKSNSPTTNTEFTMEIGGTPPTPAPTAPNAAIVDKNDSNGSNDDVVNGDGSSNNGTIESGGNGNTNNGGNNDNDGNNDVDDSGKTVDDEESQSIDSSSENLS